MQSVHSRYYATAAIIRYPGYAAPPWLISRIQHAQRLRFASQSASLRYDRCGGEGNGDEVVSRINPGNLISSCGNFPNGKYGPKAATASGLAFGQNRPCTALGNKKRCPKTSTAADLAVGQNPPQRRLGRAGWTCPAIKCSFQIRLAQLSFYRHPC